MFSSYTEHGVLKINVIVTPTLQGRACMKRSLDSTQLAGKLASIVNISSRRTAVS